MEIKKGTLLFNKIKKEYFQVVERINCRKHPRNKYRQWNYNIEPLDGRWYWKPTLEYGRLVTRLEHWKPTLEYGRLVTRLERGGLDTAYVLIEGGLCPLYSIPPGEFERRGFEIASKAAQVLYGNKEKE